MKMTAAMNCTPAHTAMSTQAFSSANARRSAIPEDTGSTPGQDNVSLCILNKIIINQKVLTKFVAINVLQIQT